MRTSWKLALALTVAALMAAPAMAQRGGGMGNFAANPYFLLLNKSVQEEMKMTADQIEKVPSFQDLQEKNRDRFAEIQGLQGEERQAKMQELMKKSAEEGEKLAKDVL